MRSYTFLGALPPGVHRFGADGRMLRSAEDASPAEAAGADAGGWRAGDAWDERAMPEIAGSPMPFPIWMGIPGAQCPSPAPDARQASDRARQQWATQTPSPGLWDEPAWPLTLSEPQKEKADADADAEFEWSAMGAAPCCPPARGAPTPGLSSMIPLAAGSYGAGEETAGSDVAADASPRAVTLGGPLGAAPRRASLHPEEQYIDEQSSAVPAATDGGRCRRSRRRPLTLSAADLAPDSGPPSLTATRPPFTPNVADEAGPMRHRTLPVELSEGKARYDRWRRTQRRQRVAIFRGRYPQLWASVGRETVRSGGCPTSARQHASTFLRRAAAHAAARDEPLEEIPATPVELQRDHAAYQRAFRQLWTERRAADPALWARCSSRQASDSRKWSKFRHCWQHGIGG